MDDYIRKQDAIDVAREDGKKIPTVAIRIMHDIKAIPVADVVVPVRCHDCKYVSEWRSEEAAKKFGQVYECRKGILNCPDPNDFCSRGKRKE